MIKSLGVTRDSMNIMMSGSKSNISGIDTAIDEDEEEDENKMDLELLEKVNDLLKNSGYIKTQIRFDQPTRKLL